MLRKEQVKVNECSQSASPQPPAFTQNYSYVSRYWTWLTVGSIAFVGCKKSAVQDASAQIADVPITTESIALADLRDGELFITTEGAQSVRRGSPVPVRLYVRPRSGRPARELTRQATWVVEPSGAGVVDPDGFHGNRPGRARVIATVNGYSAQREVEVLETLPHTRLPLLSASGGLAVESGAIEAFPDGRVSLNVRFVNYDLQLVGRRGSGGFPYVIYVAPGPNSGSMVSRSTTRRETMPVAGRIGLERLDNGYVTGRATVTLRGAPMELQFSLPMEHPEAFASSGAGVLPSLTTHRVDVTMSLESQPVKGVRVLYTIAGDAESPANEPLAFAFGLSERFDETRTGWAARGAVFEAPLAELPVHTEQSPLEVLALRVGEERVHAWDFRVPADQLANRSDAGMIPYRFELSYFEPYEQNPSQGHSHPNPLSQMPTIANRPNQVELHPGGHQHAGSESHEPQRRPGSQPVVVNLEAFGPLGADSSREVYLHFRPATVEPDVGEHFGVRTVENPQDPTRSQVNFQQLRLVPRPLWTFVVHHPQGTSASDAGVPGR